MAVLASNGWVVRALLTRFRLLRARLRSEPPWQEGPPVNVPCARCGQPAKWSRVASPASIVDAGCHVLAYLPGGQPLPGEVALCEVHAWPPRGWAHVRDRWIRMTLQWPTLVRARVRGT